MASCLSLLMLSAASPPTPLLCSHAALRRAPAVSVKPRLALSTTLLGSSLFLRPTFFPSPKPSSIHTVFAAKGYKMKAHKASAKRLGKQHLLAKKNTKRKLRMSKMLKSPLTTGRALCNQCLRHRSSKSI